MKLKENCQPVLWTHFPYGLTAKDIIEFLQGNVPPDTKLVMDGDETDIYFHITEDFEKMTFTNASEVSREEYQGNIPRVWKPTEHYKYMAQMIPDQNGSMHVINFSDSKEDLMAFCESSQIPKDRVMIVDNPFFVEDNEVDVDLDTEVNVE